MVILFVIIRDIHQFIFHCLIPQDPCLFMVKIMFLFLGIVTGIHDSVKKIYVLDKKVYLFLCLLPNHPEIHLGRLIGIRQWRSKNFSPQNLFGFAIASCNANYKLYLKLDFFCNDDFSFVSLNFWYFY